MPDSFLALLCYDYAYALDKVTENVQAVCLTPSQQGKYWKVTAKGGLNANGFISLIATGVDGEVAFTKSECEGVQQVLQAHQAGDNDSYRICAEKLTPIFLAKFAATEPVVKSASTSKANAKLLKKTNLLPQNHLQQYHLQKIAKIRK